MLRYDSAEMKNVLFLLALGACAITSCERHKFEDTKRLHSHGADAAGHGDTKAHGEEAAHGEEKPAEH